MSQSLFSKAVFMPKKKLSSHSRPQSASDMKRADGEPIIQDRLRFFRNVYYSPGELARIQQFVRPSGRALILPYDQFIEHDMRHAEAESCATDPDYIIRLAVDGGYNAVALHYGLAKRFWSKWEGEIPLILKINGKTSIPSDDKPLSVYTSSVEDAVRMGAVGIGYTMYYGSPRQDEDIPQLAAVRKLCDQFGLPLIVWAYPRGSAIDAKGGKDSNYALESAARMAMEMGASIIKSNVPKAMNECFFKDPLVPQYFRDVEKELLSLGPDQQMAERARRVVNAAAGVPVLFSGGERTDDDNFRKHSQIALDAGCFGFIFGRNIWKREEQVALKFSREICQMLDRE